MISVSGSGLILYIQLLALMLIVTPTVSLISSNEKEKGDSTVTGYVIVTCMIFLLFISSFFLEAYSYILILLIIILTIAGMCLSRKAYGITWPDNLSRGAYLLLIAMVLRNYVEISGSVLANIASLIGWFMYFSALGKMKSAMDENGIKGASRLRTAMIIGVIGTILSVIPVIRIIGGIVLIVGFLIEFSGYGKLIKSESLHEQSRKGAGLLRISMIFVILSVILGWIPGLGNILKPAFGLLTLILGVIGIYNIIYGTLNNAHSVSSSEEKPPILQNVIVAVGVLAISGCAIYFGGGDYSYSGFPKEEKADSYYLGIDEYMDGDYEAALPLLLESARKGNDISMGMYAEILLWGRGAIEPDYKKAYRWFKKSADKENSHSLFYLGYMYEMGLGVPADESKAIKYYERAVELDNATAMVALGDLLRKKGDVDNNYGRAMYLYRRAYQKDKSIRGCTYEIGMMYYNGEGFDKDMDEAFKWFEDDADKGLPEAQYMLGHMYEFGYGTAQNYKTAAELYEKAGRQGNKDAETRLELVKEKDNLQKESQKLRRQLEQEATAKENAAVEKSKSPVAGVPQEKQQKAPQNESGGTGTAKTETPATVVPDISRGLYGYYRFEGNANNTVMYGAPDGIEYNNPSYVKGLGGRGSAVSFTASKNNSIGIMEGIINSSDHTVSFWIKGVGNGHIFSVTTDHNSVFKSGYGLIVASGSLLYSMSALDNSFAYSNKTKFKHNPLNDGQWHMITLVTERRQGTTRLYIDGKYYDMVKQSVGGRGNPVRFVIGGSSGNNDFRGFDTTIDNFRIYKRTLTDEEVKMIYEFEKG